MTRKLKSFRKPKNRVFIISEKRLEEIVNKPNRRSLEQVIDDFNQQVKEMIERCKE